MKFSVIIITGLLLFSCSMENEKKALSLNEFRDSLSAEIMAVHDEVMPKQIEIQRIKKKIDLKLDTMDLEADLENKLEELSAMLDSAYRSMNVWMYEYEPMDENMSREEILDYYKNEREKIQQVKEMMLESLEKAKEIKQQ